MILPWGMSLYSLGYNWAQESELIVAALHLALQQDVPRQSLQEQWVCTGMLCLCRGISHASVGLAKCGKGKQVAWVLCDQRRV